jgi:hypothetical protein
MQGNSSSGGGAAFGYLLAQNPEAAVCLFAVGVMGVAGYFAAVAIDSPSRDLPANGMVNNSIEHCLNAKEAAQYTQGLKERLSHLWSKSLKRIESETKDTPICVDKALGDYGMRYQVMKGDTQHTGEYRVVGVSYTRPDGSQSFVVRPDNRAGAKFSTDMSPDGPMNLKTVLDSLKSVPASAYRYRLPDGTTVAALMQHDGVTQQQGSSKTYDNDGSAWADAGYMNQITAHYNFAWPANTGGGVQVAGQALAAPAPTGTW